jgi:hypothetical protein
MWRSMEAAAAALLKHIATPNVEIGTIMRRVRADVVAATHEPPRQPLVLPPNFRDVTAERVGTVVVLPLQFCVLLQNRKEISRSLS